MRFYFGIDAVCGRIDSMGNRVDRERPFFGGIYRLNKFKIYFQIKEGAEKLREVTTDRRSLSDVASIVKKSNSKLAELKSELHELESQILLTKGNTVSNGQGEHTINLYHFHLTHFVVQLYCCCWDYCECFQAFNNSIVEK